MVNLNLSEAGIHMLTPDSFFFPFIFAFLLLVFRHSSDAKQFEFYEDSGQKPLKIDTQSVKSKNSKDCVLQEPTSDGNFASNHAVERPKNNLGGRERASEASSSGVSGHGCPIRFEAKEEKADHQFATDTMSSAKSEDVAALPLEHKCSGITPVKEVVTFMPFIYLV